MRWILLFYGVGAALWLLTALAYGARSPWYRSGVGWGQLATYASLGAALGLTVLFALVDLPRPVALALALGVLAAVDVAGAIQLVNVLRLQRRDRETERSR